MQKNKQTSPPERISEREIQRIQALSNAFGASGMENEPVKEAIKICEEENLGNTHTDSMKNLYIIPDNFQESSRPAVLLDAHSDEVGFMVQSIQNNGMLNILPLGGFDPQNIQSCPVVIQTRRNGKIKAITGARASHNISRDTDKNLSYEDIFIDPGTSSREETLALGIAPGDFIVPDVECIYDENREIFLGKAFDCRIGCAALLEAMKRLEELENKSLMPLRVKYMGLLSSQEEVGERGMMTAIEEIKKSGIQAAICFEGCPADDIYVEDALVQTGLKSGPMIRYFDKSMITSPAFIDFAREIADKYNIPLQLAVRKGGGTNGKILHTHNIPTIVIGIPVRYTHSSIGYCSAIDYENAVNLAVEIVQSLSPKILEGFHTI